MKVSEVILLHKILRTTDIHICNKLLGNVLIASSRVPGFCKKPPTRIPGLEFRDDEDFQEC